MRELVAELFVTVDGFAAGEGEPAYFGFDGPDLEVWITRELARPQEILMGRVTFDLLAGMGATADDAGSRTMTALPKVVFSETLSEVSAWPNSRLIHARATADSVRALKAEDGPPLRSFGSVSLVQSLLRLGLVDRLRLVVFPLVLGDTGREPLFAGLPNLRLELADSEVLDDRLVVSDYRVVFASA